MKTKQELAGIYVASITAYDQAGNVDAAALQKLCSATSTRALQASLWAAAAASALC